MPSRLKTEKLKYLVLLVCLFCALTQNAQKELSKWWFNTQAGWDFLTVPTSTFFSANSSVYSGISSIADSNGNLLFYTNGKTIWNKNHVPMPNGTGLLSGSLGWQTALIIKKPLSSDLYYVFTTEITIQTVPNNGTRYSIVDMSLAGGSGSVTVKNVLIHFPQYTSGRLGGVQHCNGSDYWVVTDDSRGHFHSFLLSSAGVNTVAVLSPRLDSSLRANGCIKFSPNGKRLAMAVPANTNGRIELYDFNTLTGSVSPVPLNLPANIVTGCEFSPDGSKLYGCCQSPGHDIFQWDLCAGSSAAVLSSAYALNTPVHSKFMLQLAIDGKVYCSKTEGLGVINHPNLAGAACSYVDSVAFTGQFLNNCVADKLRMSAAPFTSTVMCQQVNFTGSGVLNNPLSGCGAASSPVISHSWVFGDAASGNNNTSALLNPSHFYSAPGSYTAAFIVKYACYTDTIRQLIHISTASPSFSVGGPITVCKNELHTLAGNVPAFKYIWAMSHTATGVPVFTATGQSVAVSPSATAFYTVTATDTITGCSFQRLHIVSVNACLSAEETFADNEVVKVFPNPVKGMVSVECALTNYSIRISDQLGREVVFFNALQQHSEIDLADLSAGVYYLEVLAGTNKVKHKLIRIE